MGYAERVANATEGLDHVSTGLCPTCPECQSLYDMDPQKFYARWHACEIEETASFSWSECGICGAAAGNRYVWHAVGTEGELKGKLLHFDDACPDCVCYLANGDLPRDEAEHASKPTTGVSDAC